MDIVGLIKLLTTFEGRIRRRTWWLWTVSLIGLSWIVSQIIAPLVLGDSGRVQVNPSDPFNPVYPLPLLLVMLAMGALLTWPNLAMAVKRRHDRDKSGRWMLAILLIGLALSWGGLLALAFGLGGPWFLISMAYNAPAGIYMYVVLGFLDGTQGPNRYGASPKGIGESYSDTFS